ncbi:MAG: RNA polymerase sigma factor [Patescibacteria group bacterium]|mgnify:FL=1
MNDAALISQLLSKDRRSAGIFYKAYAPKIKRYVHAKVGVYEDAEDLVQDILYAFLEAARDFRGNSSIQTYLYSIAHHKVIDYYRKKKIKQLVFSQVPQLESLISPLLDPQAQLDATLVKEKIQQVLGTLLPVHRTVLLLKYLDGVSVSGIAKQLSITLKSAESRLFRARRAFVQSFLSL